MVRIRKAASAVIYERQARRLNALMLTCGTYDAAGEFALPWQDQPAIDGLDELEREMGADSPLETLLSLCNLIPERFEYRAGVTYVGSSVSDLLQAGAGVVADSEPRLEWKETMNKARAIIRAAALAERRFRDLE